MNLIFFNNKMLICDIAQLLINIPYGTHYIDRIYIKKPYSNHSHILKIAEYDMRTFMQTDIDPNDLGYLYVGALESGNLKIAKLTGHTKDAVSIVLRSGSINRIKWVYKNISTKLGKVTYDYTKLEIAKWLHETYPYNPNTIINVLNDDNLIYVMWYFDTYGEQHYTYADLLYELKNTDNTKIFSWLCNTYKLEDIIEEIIADGIEECSIYIVVFIASRYPDKFNYDYYSADVIEYMKYK